MSLLRPGAGLGAPGAPSLSPNPSPPLPLGMEGNGCSGEKFSREPKLLLVREEGAGGAASGGVPPPRLRVEVSVSVRRSLPLCVESRPGV